MDRRSRQNYPSRQTRAPSVRFHPLAHWKGLGLALDQIATRAEGHPSRTLSGKLVARRFGTFATLSTRYGRGPEARQTCAAEAFKLGGRTLRVFASDEEIAKVRDNHESIGRRNIC